MKNSAIVITSILLVVSIGNYRMIVSDSPIRTVEFLSILAIGIFGGVLLTQIIKTARNKK